VDLIGNAVVEKVLQIPANEINGGTTPDLGLIGLPKWAEQKVPSFASRSIRPTNHLTVTDSGQL
jgi:hypothetical protein